MTPNACPLGTPIFKMASKFFIHCFKASIDARAIQYILVRVRCPSVRAPVRCERSLDTNTHRLLVAPYLAHERRIANVSTLRAT